MTANGEAGVAYGFGPVTDAGDFWFLSPDGEVVFGALGACDFTRRFSSFSSGPTTFQIVFTDISTGDVRTYTSPPDPDAFADCSTVPLFVTVSRYRFSPGGPDDPPIRLSSGVTYRLTFHSADVEHGISAIPALGIAAARVAPGSDYVITITPTAEQRGLYYFACTHVCGADHGSMHGAIEVE